MQVEIVGENLVITAPINKTLSKSEKSFLLVSSGGNQETECVVDGQNVIVGLNAYVKNPDYIAPPKGQKKK